MVKVTPYLKVPGAEEDLGAASFASEEAAEAAILGLVDFVHSGVNLDDPNVELSLTIEYTSAQEDAELNLRNGYL